MTDTAPRLDPYPFLIGCLRRTPDTYHLAGIKRGTATSNFHAQRDNLWSNRQCRLVGNATSSSGRADGQPPAARRTARYSSMTITGQVSTGQSLGSVSASGPPPSSGSAALTASGAA
jgi:hypothetical protein